MFTYLENSKSNPVINKATLYKPQVTDLVIDYNNFNPKIAAGKEDVSVKKEVAA